MNESYTEVVDSSLTGSIFKGTYRVTELIGQGGMAWVYRATHIQLGGEVALKILFSHLSRDVAKRHRFLQEARIQHQLSHPNIVRVQDTIEENESTGFVMEWCNRGTLLHLLQQAGGPLSMEQMHDLFPSMIDALGYAHQRQVIHRDLKPQNVLLHVAGSSIQPKITDFGIAKTVGDVGLTRTGEVMGTLEYASPEQLKDSKSVDHRSDIYSIGVLLYRMATGRIPFSGSPARVIRQVLHEAPPRPTEAPARLQPLIMRCLEKNPDHRFATCDDLKEAFFSLIDAPRSSDSLRAILPSDLHDYVENEEHEAPATVDLKKPIRVKQPTILGDTNSHVHENSLVLSDQESGEDKQTRVQNKRGVASSLISWILSGVVIGLLLLLLLVLWSKR